LFRYSLEFLFITYLRNREEEGERGRERRGEEGERGEEGREVS
jgi:hypothetical protein